MKQCSKCKLEKNTSEFYPDKRTKSGLYSACKSCHQIKYVREFRVKNKESYNKYEMERRAKNREHNNKYAREWRVKNMEHSNKYHREYQKLRKQTDPKYRLDCNLASIICMALKGEKNRRGWEKLVGYTIEDLVKHLENQFTEGMSWDNYGSWEIDHIKPKSLFKYETAEDAEFKKCWALENLQPLNKMENRNKYNKYITN
jgi:hypothetical protein